MSFTEEDHSMLMKAHDLVFTTFLTEGEYFNFWLEKFIEFASQGQGLVKKNNFKLRRENNDLTEERKKKILFYNSSIPTTPRTQTDGEAVPTVSSQGLFVLMHTTVPQSLF